MFIIRAFFWLAIVLLLIPAVAESGHGGSARAGSVEAAPDSRAPFGS